MKLIGFFSLFAMLILLSSCRNQNTIRDQVDVEELTGFGEIEEVKQVYYRFPSPDEMLGFINQEDLIFNDELLLPVDNARSFLDSKAQALNLGIYTADLAYVTLFQRQKEALIYFQVVYGLCEKLRITSAFEPGLLKRFQENMSNPDSLKSLSDEAFGGISDYLVAEDKEKVFAIISIGGFVESLYLAFNMVDEFSSDNPIIQRISDQKIVLENLLNYAMEYSEDINVFEAIAITQPLRAVFSEILQSNSETQVSKSEDGKLIIGGGPKLSITAEQFEELKLATHQARKKISENLDI